MLIAALAVAYGTVSYVHLENRTEDLKGQSQGLCAVVRATSEFVTDQVPLDGLTPERAAVIERRNKERSKERAKLNQLSKELSCE